MTQLASRFLRDSRGNILLMFGLLVVPLLLFVGLAIDSARGYAAQQRMSNALDAAARSAFSQLRAGNIGETEEEISQAIRDYYIANYGLTEAEDDIQLQPLEISLFGDGGVNIVARGTVSTTFMRLIGRESMTIVARIGERAETPARLEVVLIIDESTVTNSRIPSLLRADDVKETVKDIAREVLGKDENQTLTRLGIVPYAGAVKLDPANWQEYDFIDWNGASSIHFEIFPHDAGRPPSATRYSRGALYRDMPGGIAAAWNGCLETRPFPLDETDALPTGGDSLFVPWFAPDEVDTDLRSPEDWFFDDRAFLTANDYLDDDCPVDCSRGPSTEPSPSREQGTGSFRVYKDNLMGNVQKYTGSDFRSLRRNEDDWRDPAGPWTELGSHKLTLPDVGGTATYVSACGAGLQPILPLLTHDPDDPDIDPLDTINARIDAMGEDSLANHPRVYRPRIHPIGLMWGWRLLSETEPFTEAEPYDEDVRKVAVLVTNGPNFLGLPLRSALHAYNADPGDNLINFGSPISNNQNNAYVLPQFGWPYTPYSAYGYYLTNGRLRGHNPDFVRLKSVNIGAVGSARILDEASFGGRFMTVALDRLRRKMVGTNRICTRMKRAGIEIYVLDAGNGSDFLFQPPISEYRRSQLEPCASSRSHVYSFNQRQQLVDKIGELTAEALATQDDEEGGTPSGG